jgi:hypothetical protein
MILNIRTMSTLHNRSNLTKGIAVKHIKKTLPVLIASVLAAGSVQAQSTCEELEGTPPGLYATTEEGRTFLIKDGQVVELGPGEAGFADETGVKCIQRIPQFMDWPCSTDAAKSRKFATYSIDELTDDNKAREIVRRYFEVPEVIEPIPNWKEGEYHLMMSENEILQFSSSEYWYHPNANRDIMDERRPKTLQIALFVGINQVVVDSVHLKALSKHYGGAEIPVVFTFNDSNMVPISYFGPNVSLEEVAKANSERGINIAPVPMWELGDYNIRPSMAEMQKYFDLPAIEDIPADRRAALEADLEANGFTRKPVFVSILGGSSNMVVDQPQRVAVAASMGMTSVPVSLTIIQPDILVARCGPGVPTGTDGASSISGDTTPEGGSALPPGTPVVPPPPEPEASDS